MRNNFFKVVFLTFIFTTLSFGISFTNVHASGNNSLVTTEYTLYDNLTSIEQENLIEKVPTSSVTHDKENFKLVFKKADSATNSILPTNNTKLELPQKISKTSSNTLPKTGAMKNNILISLLGFSVLVLVLFLLIWKRKHLKTFLSLLIVLGGSNFFTNYDEAHADEGILPTVDSTILAKGSNYTPNVDLAGYKYIGYLHTYSNDNKPFVKEGQVIVKYKDSNGDTLSKDIILKGNIGDSYAAEQKSFEGYTFKNVIGNTSGSFTEAPQTVTFIFEKNPIPTSTVTVSYQDTDGNKLSDDIILTGAIGDSYTANKKTFEGYTFDTVQGSITGTYLNEAQTVVFIYKKEPVLGNITLKQSGFINATDRGYIKPNFYKVTYYDKTGNILKTEEIDKDTTISDETISTNVGSEYTVYSKITYECYSINTGERLAWGDYELVANDPELTSGILKEPNLTIEYTFKDLSWA